MATWTADQLERIGRATEVSIASRRTDGTLSPYVTIWGVRSGNDLYIRSAHGPDNGWYRRAKTRRAGRIQAGGVKQDVRFDEPAADVHPGIDAAYHAKYDRYGQQIVGTVVGPAAAAVTLRMTPVDVPCCLFDGGKGLALRASVSAADQRGDDALPGSVGQPRVGEGIPTQLHRRYLL